MPALILPRRFTSQPQGAVEIDWGNELTRNLLTSITPGVFDPKHVLNPTDSTAYIVATEMGLGYLLPASTGYWNSNYFADLRPTNQLTVNMLYQPKVGGAHLGGLVVSDSYNNNQGYMLLQGGTAGNTATFYIRDEGSWYPVSTSSILTPEKPVTITGTYDGLNLRIYVNGKFIALTAHTGSITYNTINQPFKLGDYSGLKSSAIISKVDIYSRALSEPEIKNLYSNPWQLFRAKPRVLYFDVGGATIPTLSSPGVTNILTTSATPQVTLTF